MKTFKSILAVLLVASLVLACEGKKSESSTSTETVAEQNYSCPMHPEVTGKEGDTCSKCGMKLEKAAADSVSTSGPKK